MNTDQGTTDVEVIEQAAPAHKLITAQQLCRPWAKQLSTLGRVFITQYPPKETSLEVQRAVTVPVPYAAFFAMIVAMDAVMSQPEPEVK